MNLDEAVELLNTLRRPDNWGNRHDDHYDTLALGNQKYSLGPNVPLNSFPPSNSDSNIINGLSNSININNTLLNNMSSPLVQKMLLQEMVPQGLTTNQGLTANRNLQSQPSSHQLKILVGQIQMAVQAGFLNNQVSISVQPCTFFYNLILVITKRIHIFLKLIAENKNR